MRFRYYLDLVIILTKKEFIVRYKNSLLGYFWSVAHPLAYVFVFYIAFKIVMKVPIENYTLFLIAGLFPWHWFSNSLNYSSVLFISNSSLIKKLAFPKYTVIFSAVLQDMIHFIISIPIIAILMTLWYSSPSLIWLYSIPVMLFLQFLLVFGMSLTVATLNLFFRDLERFISILTMLLFYFTPIIYSIDMVPNRYKDVIILLNPMASFIINWRNIFFNEGLNIYLFAISILYSIFSIGIGIFIYEKLSHKFAEVL